MNTYWNQSALLKGGLVADDLKWEATKTFDIALEGSLFDDRLGFSIGYFDKRNADLIFNVTQPLSIGCAGVTGSNPSIATNIGTMSNRGWELSFNVDIIRSQDFNWSASVDASFIKNKIISLPNGEDIIGGLQRRSEGKSMYEYCTYTYAGVDQMNGRALYVLDRNSYEITYGRTPEAADEVFNSRLEGAKKNGSYAFERNGIHYVYDSNYASKDWKGSALPTVFGSFGTNLNWKGINLGMLFTYSLGGKTFDSNYQELMSRDNTARQVSAMHEDILKSWTHAPEGMTPDSPNRIDPNGIPQTNKYYNQYNGSDSSRWLVSASYLTLKNINISYDLPSKWMQAMKLSGINLGFSMDNVFIVAARKGLNPTYSFGGGQGAYYVPARTYTFQLSVKF